MAQRGFTIIELMVALAIAAILAAIAYPSYVTWQERDGLTEGTMFLKSALSTARSRTIQNGLGCACSPGVACTASHAVNGCTSRAFGVRLDPANDRVRLVRLCDSNGDICDGDTATAAVDSGELSPVWERELSRYVAINTSDTTSNVLNNGLFFSKSGVVSGSAGSIFLTAGGKARCVAVSNTGRIREGVPDGTGSCD